MKRSISSPTSHLLQEESEQRGDYVHISYTLASEPIAEEYYRGFGILIRHVVYNKLAPR
jgi:hypothetical protein